MAVSTANSSSHRPLIGGTCNSFLFLGSRNRIVRWALVIALMIGAPALGYDDDDDGHTKKPDAPKPRPTGSAAGSAGSAAKSQVLTEAIEKLTTEYKDAAKSKSFEDLRTSSDYFSEPPDDATPAVVLAALEKPVGSDPRLNAYVKWQLLSAVKETFPEDLASRAAKLYMKAPPLAPRPGMGANDKAELNRLAGSAKEDDLAALNEKFGQLLSRFEEQNKLVLNYRDELFRKLPPGVETFEAALKDGHERVSAGVDTTTFWSDLSGSMTKWAEGANASAKEYKRVADLLEKVGDHKSAEYPTEAVWEPKDKRAKWKTFSSTLAAPRERYEVINLLRDKAGLQPAEAKEDKPSEGAGDKPGNKKEGAQDDNNNKKVRKPEKPQQQQQQKQQKEEGKSE